MLNLLDHKGHLLPLGQTPVAEIILLVVAVRVEEAVEAVAGVTLVAVAGVSAVELPQAAARVAIRDHLPNNNNSSSSSPLRMMAEDEEGDASTTMVDGADGLMTWSSMT